MLALSLLEAKQKRFDNVMPLLDSIPLKIPQDLRAKEFIAAALGTQDETVEYSDPQRTEAALNRLLNFPLSDQELFQLLPLLEKTKRNADAHSVLTQLVETTNDRRIQNELLHRLRDVPAEERDNAVKIAQRIFRNPGYFSEPRHFALDSYIFCTAAEVLKKEQQSDAMSEVLKQRCQRIQDKVVGSIVLAQLYVIVGKEDEAKELTAYLAKHPSYESERRNAITALLQHFGMKKELEEMNLLLLEAPSSRREPQ